MLLSCGSVEILNCIFNHPPLSSIPSKKHAALYFYPQLCWYGERKVNNVWRICAFHSTLSDVRVGKVLTYHPIASLSRLGRRMIRPLMILTLECVEWNTPYPWFCSNGTSSSILFSTNNLLISAPQLLYRRDLNSKCNIFIGQLINSCPSIIPDSKVDAQLKDGGWGAKLWIGPNTLKWLFHV